MNNILGAIAANRFGLGARPGEIAAAAQDPRGWLKAQILPSSAVVPAGALPSVEAVFKDRQSAYAGMPAQNPGRFRAEVTTATDPSAPAGAADPRTPAQMIRQQVQREARDDLQLEIAARERFAASTPNAFAERWARFWANHFTVAARNAQLIGIVGPFERDAIRPHVFGSFAGLLAHATFHPTMLIYLDAARSIGPSTEFAQRRKAGLNENLAREILELHTLGVGSGYTQSDIIEFAKALTGWTVGGQNPNPGPAQRAVRLAQARSSGRMRGPVGEARLAALELNSYPGQTVFMAPFHEPGERRLLGKTYPGDAKKQAGAILDDLAAHPATAKHIATKLARHFVADEPPASAVAKLETTFRRSHGDLTTLAQAVVDLDEAWGEPAIKFKTPEELLVSVARATSPEVAFGRDQRGIYQALAQRPFTAPSPAGWPDAAASWSGADAVMKRLEWANAVARRIATSQSPNEFLELALGPTVGEKTRLAVSRAESAEQGFTLALMSPEFQRR